MTGDHHVSKGSVTVSKGRLASMDRLAFRAVRDSLWLGCAQLLHPLKSH
jgi:hypothetical protein